MLTAVRDAELKTRFCGYESTHYKLFVWTLSAMLCGLAGALYVPQVGIINPSEMQPSNSIEMAIWVAVGGRGSLVGAVIGAVIVAGGKSWLTNTIPSAWLYVLGALFVVVTLFLPRGVVGLVPKLQARPRRRSPAKGGAAVVSAPAVTRTRAPEDATPIISMPIPEAAHRPLVLWVEELSVSFDGFKALTDVSLELEQGELRCLIGPNGAGKTTLMDVITGKTRPTKGGVFLDRRDVDLTKLSECRIAELGVGRKFQRPTVFQGHTVYENCELALRGRKGVWSALFTRRTAAERERIEEVMEIIGLANQSTREAGLLSHGQKQWLEIGMLLAQDPKVLLVDEPVAGMTHAEMERTAELLRSLAGKHTIVVVEHDMEFVRSIARRVTVLHEGKVLADGPMAQIQADPRVVEVYLGE